MLLLKTLSNFSHRHTKLQFNNFNSVDFETILFPKVNQKQNQVNHRQYHLLFSTNAKFMERFPFVIYKLKDTFGFYSEFSNSKLKIISIFPL